MKNPNRPTSLFVLTLTLISFVPSCKGNTVSSSETGHRNNTGDTGFINEVRPMATQRAAHTATLLPDGKVLVAGGFAGEANSLSSTEVFDPATRTFVPGGKMNAARSSHTATLLPNGKVLIA